MGTGHAGESLRIEIERMDEDFNDTFMSIGFYVFIPLSMNVVSIATAEGLLKWVIITVMALVGSLLVLLGSFKALKILDRRNRYRLGFDGERFVGEHLSTIMLDGYRVFHDVPFDDFNVDHVVVGPAGVFAIETKTRRKRKGLKDNHKVKFDGAKLHWPDNEVNDYGVQNAYDRAKSLQQWLSSAVGTSVTVAPMLVFPGWMVQEQRLGKVRVLNPKNVRGHIKAIEKKNEALSDQRIQQIVHQLSEKVKLPE